MALGEVMARFVEHLLALELEVEPLIEATDVNLTWYVGLDAQGTQIGDALWRGEEFDDSMRSRIVGPLLSELGHISDLDNPLAAEQA